MQFLSRINEKKWLTYPMRFQGENGSINEIDFRYVLSTLGGIDNSDVVDEIFAEVDVDGNGMHIICDLQLRRCGAQPVLENEISKVDGSGPSGYHAESLQQARNFACL